VPKILVADDNSNVQKTVALALTDLGVEVVAVNNGDAAIRKLADIAPDLVLADIFMPVRNGYEVCEYVKKDTRFSNVPVVLLVGAFDPLDEREAQRVGADGILKKPFVPPDPLMTMVKTLLDRTLGDRFVAVAASKPAATVQEKAGGPVTAVEPPPRPAPAAPEEFPEEEEFQPPPDRLSFGEGDRPIAFGQLLDTPAKESADAETDVVEPVDDEQILTSSRDASLGEPAFWKTEEPEPESDEENSEVGEEETEMGGDAPAALPSRAWKLEENPKPSPAEADVVEPVDPLELVRDQDEEGQAPAVVASSECILQDAASQAPLTVEAGKPEDLAANPIEWMATAPPQHDEESEEAIPEWSVAETETADDLDSSETHNMQSVPELVVPNSPVPAAPVPSIASSTPATPPAPPRATQPAQPQAKTAAEGSDPIKTQPSMKPFSQSAEETARSILKQEWADLAANLQPKAIEPIAEKGKPAPGTVAQVPPPAAPNGQPAQANSAAGAPPDPALVETVVQRILDKMSPQVVDLITKEFLRPIVQALVHREIEKH
jgi:CheY-like chemotaxis protein